VTLEALGLVGESVATKTGAQTTLANLDDALTKINSVRADLGAMQNRMQSTINSLSISDENLSAANSRIRDADLAQEVSDMTKYNILMQSGISVLGQANQQSQAALKLLG
jgi:flagellin